MLIFGLNDKSKNIQINGICDHFEYMLVFIVLNLLTYFDISISKINEWSIEVNYSPHTINFYEQLYFLKIQGQ